MNPLTDIIPATARKWLYVAFAVAGLVLGVCQIIEVNTGKAAEVLAYLGIALGLTAASNTPAEPPSDH